MSLEASYLELARASGLHSLGKYLQVTIVPKRRLGETARVEDVYRFIALISANGKRSLIPMQ